MIDPTQSGHEALKASLGAVGHVGDNAAWRGYDGQPLDPLWFVLAMLAAPVVVKVMGVMVALVDRLSLYRWSKRYGSRRQ